MKLKLLFQSFFLVFSYISMSATSYRSYLTLCYAGPYKMGKIFIVNENNQIISNAKVWIFYSLNDSIIMPKTRLNRVENDTNAYFVWSNSFNTKNNITTFINRNKIFRIQAEGYADIIINDFSFKRVSKLAQFYITMYPKKYLNKGNLLTLMNEYVCEKKLEIKDSVRLTFNDYNESERKGNSTAEAIRIANNIIKTYPNPVKDKLFIEVNADLTKPYKYKITDILGNELSENELIEQKTTVNMEWQVAGIYIISVYNSEEEMLYSLKFIKTE